MSGPPADLGGGALLRRFRIEDLEEVYAAVEAERDRIGVWMPWVEGLRSIEDERAWLERVIAGSSPEGCGIWVEGEFAGGIGLMVDAFGVTGEIGYWIRSAFEGRGLVSRACRALIEHGFEDLGIHRIFIRAGVENLRSRAVPERLGFTYEGIHREEGRGSRGFYDLAVYGLLENEWPKRRRAAPPT